MVSLKAEIQDTSTAFDRVSQDTNHAEKNLKSLNEKSGAAIKQANEKEEMFQKIQGINKHLTNKNLNLTWHGQD